MQDKNTPDPRPSSIPCVSHNGWVKAHRNLLDNPDYCALTIPQALTYHRMALIARALGPLTGCIAGRGGTVLTLRHMAAEMHIARSTLAEAIPVLIAADFVERRCVDGKTYLAIVGINPDAKLMQRTSELRQERARARAADPREQWRHYQYMDKYSE